MRSCTAPVGTWKIGLKEQMMLFADRTSTSWLRSNQIRLYCSTVAYLLMQALLQILTRFLSCTKEWLLR